MTEKDQKKIFESWLSQYKGLIFKVVRAYADTSLDQDDLFQEITIQIWHSVPSFRQESSVTTWIYRIGLNTAIKWTTRKKRNPTEPIESARHVLRESRTEPDERLIWLYEEIYKLDAIDRSLTLLLLDSFSYKEMARRKRVAQPNYIKEKQRPTYQ